MDSAGLRAATSTGDNKRRVKKKNRDRHKRPHLRKTAVQPPTMQSEDKRRGPKKIVEGWKKSTVWPSSKKPPRGAQQGRNRAIDSGNTLRFTCSQCGDDSEYVPKDLVRHFEDKHKGSPPVFSCHVCAFSAHEFSYLQVHLLSHNDTFSSCGVCNDNVQRTWPEFSTHLTMHHCKNGKFSCAMCHQFSTSDVRGFLEHMHGHNLGPTGANEDRSLRTRDKNKSGPKTPKLTLRCQHCGYEASQKWLIAKHIKAAHVRKKKKEVDSIAVKPNDPVPKIKPRLTRSAVREMCWLTQDCLSLPGREFLDKYCHLSDPQTTLEETRKFLMKSVAGETGDQKWTKALQSVLSNVPQDIHLHPKSENGVMSNSSDLTVLTVKNKITVAQNGATYAKRLKMMTSSDTVSPESAADHACCVVDQKGCQSNLNDPTSCPQTETKLDNEVPLPAQEEPSQHAQMQENRENREVKADLETKEDCKRQEEPLHDEGADIPSELNLTNKSEEQTSVQRVAPKTKRRKRRRKTKAASKKVVKTSEGVALKLVLKKNPVKEKQWVSQSSLSPTGGDCHGLPPPTSQRTVEDQTEQILQKVQLEDVHQAKPTKVSESDVHHASEAIATIPQSKPGEEPTGTEHVEGNQAPIQLGDSPSTHREIGADAQKPEQLLEAEVGEGDRAGRTGQADVRDAEVAQAEVFSENLLTPGCSMDSHVSDDTMSSAADDDGATPHTKSTPPVITPHGQIHSEDSSLEGRRERDSPYPDLLSDANLPTEEAPIQQEPSPAPGHQWQPVPKTLERTLKLVPINPSQPVKRPALDQPVVVLNHPDADIPEVGRIMEVVNRYKGDAKRVVLSRRTADALSTTKVETPNQPDSMMGKRAQSSVQERFMLKLKLRRLTRKKYEVVGVDSQGRDAQTTFRCWYCGRVFTSQETWMLHRQRHLAEWNRPNCENS